MLTMTKTPFANWLEAMGFTVQQGADALGLSKSRAMEFATGRSRNTARAAPALDLRTRLAMAAIAKKLQPWPEE